jgi:hypothetical protein
MVRVVLRLCALFVLLAMTSCGVPNGNAASPGPGVSGASQPAPSAGAEPVAGFLAGVRSARYADYAGKPGTQVASEPAFEEMRRYVLDRYGTAPVSRSYLLGGATFDCVGTASAPAADAGCPPGTAPVRRVTLAELARFPTLQAFLGKDPGGGGLPPVPPPTR